MNDYDEFMSRPEPEVRSEEALIEAIFQAADEYMGIDRYDGKAWAAVERKLSDAIDEAMSHAYAEGRADEKREHTERTLRAMNETGQGEHGVTKTNGHVHPILADILNQHLGGKRAA